MTAARAAALGLVLGPPKAALEPLSVAHRDPVMGFEIEPFPDRRAYQPITVARGTAAAVPLLTLTGRAGERMDAVAYTSWGGYALYPYNVITLPGQTSKRWVVDPFAFFRHTLALPDMPVPDTTTETGRRLLLAHIDGDGFASRAETRERHYSGEVLLSDILARYRIPHTISIIEGEISANGVHPELAPVLEPIARKIFAQDNVEIASHSFSHPFRWRAAEASATLTSVTASETYALKIPNYTYSTHAEVQGSIDYINASLAPRGKRTRVFLWTGDCDPDEAPLAATDAAGVYNMNGGDTFITRADPSITLVSPLGIPRGKYFQVYAPNQNENVYTKLWEGPYYGFERVVETFDLTESPRRLKPVDIYYHMYSTTKTASLSALHKVYAWALARPMHPVYASEYIAKVIDFQHMVLARDLDGTWLARGANALRTLRVDAGLGFPSGEGIAGYARHEKSSYIHLSTDEARFALRKDAPAGPSLADANARVTVFQTSSDGIRLALAGHAPLEFSLRGAERCSVSVTGKTLRPGKSGLYTLSSHAADDIAVRCP